MVGCRSLTFRKYFFSSSSEPLKIKNMSSMKLFQSMIALVRGCIFYVSKFPM